MSEAKTNRQTLRSRRKLRNSLLDLLKEKPYKKVTISSITKRANLARSTFYAHFDTKEELMESILDEILDQFFEYLYERDVANPDQEEDLEINIRFFKIWRENADIIELLNGIDVDFMLIKKFNKYWSDYYRKHFSPSFPDHTSELQKYINEYLAYSFVGILRCWIADDMKHPPEIIGGLLYQLTGPPALVAAYEKYHTLMVLS